MITILSFSVISITLLYLYILFFTGDVTVSYVWQYTRTSHPLIYKFSGVLGGMAGSLLFWIWAIITPWFYEEIKSVKKSIDFATRDWIRIAVFSIIAILTFVLSLHDIFKPTAQNLLLSQPTGQGMNPLLQTELMAIHPPIVFLAYGFLVIPFAAALAYLITGHKDWLSYSLKWSRLGWFFLTLGIGIGAIWAYVVLGWGGYWGWDPVETSSLLPWIILTGFLHAQLMHKRKKEYPIFAPVLGIFSFILVLFATFVTRAGGIWVSVHTFGQANVMIDPMKRFLNILGESQTILTYTILIIICLIITTILVIYRYIKMKKSRNERFYTLGELISDDMLMLGTVFLFVIITLVTLIMLFNSVNGYDPNDFNINVGILCLVTSLVLIFCLLWKYTGRKWITIIGGLTLLASIIGFFAYPDNGVVGGFSPIIIVAIIATGYKLIKSFNYKKIWKSMKLVSAHLIHLSVMLLLLGYVGSNFLVSEESVYLSIGDDGQDVRGYNIRAINYGIVDGIKYVNIDADEQSFTYRTEYVDIIVSDGNNIIGNERLIIVLSTSLVNGEIQILRKEVKIFDTITEDIYVIYEQANVDDQGNLENFRMTVKIIPLIKLVWNGMWLMSIGMIIRIASGKKLKGEKYRFTEEGKGGKRSKIEQYYEDLVEKELNN